MHSPHWRTSSAAWFSLCPAMLFTAVALPSLRAPAQDRKPLAVTGKITDETGKPIVKALVRTRVDNGTRSAFTDEQGAYRLEGCERGNARFVAEAKGRAPDFQDVEISPDLRPVDFHLKPGNTIRVRVVDETGRPVPNATVFVHRWRFESFQFDNAPRQTDVDGLWEWNEAPPDDVQANIARPKGMTLSTRSLSPRKQEYVFRVPPELVISGKVVDAETHQPIKGFRLASGQVFMGQQAVFQRINKPAPTGSTYEIRKTHETDAYLVRVEAEGYLPAVSREIKSDEGRVTIDFELVKGNTVTATVLTPDGAPAVRAKVALPARREQVMISEGELQEHGGNPNFGGLEVGLVHQFRQARRWADVCETDREGKFRAEAKNTNCWIVITHPAGYVELAGTPDSNPRVIKLKPWARIEGTFQVARQPRANVPISAFKNLIGPDSPQIMVHSLQTTDAHGRFAFDRVVPGLQHITSNPPIDSGKAGMTSSMTIAVNCHRGQTTRAEFGTTGRPVIGQLRKPPDAKSDVQLSAAQIFVGGGQVWAESELQFHATPARDGNFAINDMPPGNYSLSVFMPGEQGLQIQQHRFVVPQADDNLWRRPVDLGVLTLDSRNGL